MAASYRRSVTYLIIKSPVFSSPRSKTSDGGERGGNARNQLRERHSLGVSPSDVGGNAPRRAIAPRARNRACLINVRVPVERIRIGRDQAARDCCSSVSNPAPNDREAKCDGRSVPVRDACDFATPRVPGKSNIALFEFLSRGQAKKRSILNP